jgi:hypothetical protein
MVAMSKDGSSFTVDLAEIRKELDLSQTELAALLAVSPRRGGVKSRVQLQEYCWRIARSPEMPRHPTLLK